MLLITLLLGAAGCTSSEADPGRLHPSPSAAHDGWDRTIPQAEVEAYARVTVPAVARDIRWGYKHGFQDDAAALTFVMPSAEVGIFLRSIDGEHEEFFAKIDAPGPEEFQKSVSRGVRFTQPTAGTAEDLNIWTAKVAEAEARVWIEAFDL
ncbi:hypothetical protein [Streptomyces sp. CB03234]|uniref:hypothetical protein n=1 Tax=Streptomyces sp. (strain CB03234) TaxID=1703937 RepID=UPI001180AE62|nr:hypothetical protein [Streptomyces sp. CB03234]